MEEEVEVVEDPDQAEVVESEAVRGKSAQGTNAIKLIAISDRSIHFIGKTTPIL